MLFIVLLCVSRSSGSFSVFDRTPHGTREYLFAVKTKENTNLDSGLKTEFSEQLGEHLQNKDRQ